MTALVIDDLVVHHGGVTAVDGVSLHVEAGTIAGLIGPNGAGKTSLLDVCCGLVSSTGTVMVRDHDLAGLGHASRARHGLGRTFQRPALFDSMTVADNVGLGWEGSDAGSRPRRHVFTRRQDATTRSARLGEALRLCGLGHLAATPAAQLTTGQRRLVELARVLAGDFAVLLLDEPGAGLDDSEKDELAGILQSVRQTGQIAVLLVEHDLRLVTRLCTTLFVVEAGRRIFAGPPDAAMRDDGVRLAYLGAGVR